MSNDTDGRAVRTKSIFRMEYAINQNIRAPRDRVWSLLTDAAGFSRWNSTVQSIEGMIAQGQKINLRATVAPNRVFNLLISEFVPNERMVWRDGAAPMFSGVRTFTLTGDADTTRFTMAEVYSGLMLPFIAGSLPNFIPVFETYARDLKRAAEVSI